MSAKNALLLFYGVSAWTIWRGNGNDHGDVVTRSLNENEVASAAYVKRTTRSAIASLFTPRRATWAIAVTLLAHVLEFVLFQKRIRRAARTTRTSLAYHFVQTLLYGLLHVRSLPSA